MGKGGPASLHRRGPTASQGEDKMQNHTAGQSVLRGLLLIVPARACQHLDAAVLRGPGGRLGEREGGELVLPVRVMGTLAVDARERRRTASPPRPGFPSGRK